MTPVIFGLSGTTISADERAFFQETDPAGYILFKRNIVDHAQVRALTADLRALSGREALPILIDQEGGRVARLQPPLWPEFPSGAQFGALYAAAPMTAIAAARANGEALGHVLADLGITVNCAPVLDLHFPETHDSIGDRSFGDDPSRVAALGQALLAGMQRGGVVGVIKHMPGQGRATVDSHHDLPRVFDKTQALEADIMPFKLLNKALIGMAGHVVFEAWDTERPASASPFVIQDIIRQRIKFEGLLLSDDIEMKALSGRSSDRALACLRAGCDIVLHCSGDLAAMIDIAQHVPDISDAARARLDAAMSTARPKFDAARLADAIYRRDQLFAAAA
jgi:beta-N-acetylhexosaminidase